MRKILAWIIEHIVGKIGIPWSREVENEELWFFRGTKTHPLRANKSFKKYEDAVKWRNEYVIDNGLLGEFKLI